MPARELVDDHPADVVAVARVLATGLPRPATSRSSVEARRPDGEAQGLLLVGCCLAGLRPSALGSSPSASSPSPSLALDLLFLLDLGLDLDPRRGETVAMTVSCGSSRKVTARRRRRSSRRSTSPIVERGDVDLDVLGDLGRKRLDLELARDEREDAAGLHTLGLADELDDDRRLDRLVEPDLAQVDVRDGAADRVLLVVGEDRRVDGLLALDGRRRGSRAGRRARSARPRSCSGTAIARASPCRRGRRERDPGRAGAATHASRARPLAHLELEPVPGHGGGL